jgi:DNA-binding NarL/FixJ family response regulator
MFGSVADESRPAPTSRDGLGFADGMSRPRIVIADEHGILLDGLKRILEPEFEVVAMVRDGHALIRAVEALRPELVVAGILMPMLNGIEALRKLKSAGTTTKFVFLSGSCDIGIATQALRLGASCYVLKQSACDDLIAAIHAALDGQTYIAPRIAPAVFQHMIDHPGKEGTQHLTMRERQVLQLLAEGNTLKEAAAVLKVSPRTVEFHRNNIANKTGFHSLAELSRHAVGLGLVSLRP